MRWMTLLLIVACGAPPTGGVPEPTQANAPKATQAGAPEATQAGAPEAGASSASASAPAGDWTTYGGAWSDAQVVPVQTVLDDPGAYAGKALTVEGEISDVCQKRGCWMVVSDGKRTMRVTMKDHAFGVDMASTGARAQVQGELVAKAVDPKTVEHYKSEAARPEVIPETAAGDGPSYELVASTVRIRR